MKNKYATNPAALAEWASASHIERAPRRKKGAGKPSAEKGPEESAPPSGQ